MASAQDSSIKKSGFTSTTTIMMIFVSGYFIDFAFNIFLARHMGSNDYGNFKVAEAFIYLGSIITMMGGASAAPRLLLPHIKNPNKEGVWGYVRFYIIVSTIVSIVLLVLIVIGHYLHISTFSGNGYHPLLLAAIVIPLAGISGLLCGVLHAANRLDLAFIPWGLGYSTLAFLFCFIASLIFGQISSFMAVGLVGAVVLSLIFFSLVCIYRLSLMPLKNIVRVGNRSQWLKISFPIMVVAALQMFMRQVDIYMIEFMAGEIAVGHFAAATVTTFVIIVIQLGLIALFSPQVVEALNKGQGTIRALNRKSMVLSFLLVLPLSLLLILFGHQILDFFGHDVDLAFNALKALTIGYAITALMSVPIIWLQYGGAEKSIMVLLIISVVSNIFLNWLLIPILNIEGAAIATSLAMSISAVGAIIIMKFKLGIFPWSGQSRMAKAE
ncbi:hypothetical protein D5R81_00500 [Parashewanella spongiae]|uniref:Uncharacterized protein n=1 Tax=Parashewanella spongiae TaxID=342950 RepID=A0A3A6UBR6_9GAMM|nr:oligosaccharide flippase family protein [Parashewanella spongiae]MCL1076719.1 oligosaccharide flippase family protein [Parashewanella spongiae]RJY19463.1 hypothetical protein D5R81_00500 [Parashewanella spongiae]